MRKYLLAFVMSLALAGTALAETYADALAAYSRGDYATALRLYRPMADGGDARAQYGLGEMYGEGRGVPQDYAEAAKWFRRAADQGVAYAQFNLGLLYATGKGVPQDYPAAVKWYREAADQGVADAQYSLGSLYLNGLGVPQDYVEAHKWLNLAASASQAGLRPSAVKLRDIVAAKMTPQQIAEAQKLAREWKPK